MIYTPFTFKHDRFYLDFRHQNKDTGITMHKKIFSLFFLFWGFHASVFIAQEIPGFSSITGEELLNTVKILSGREFGGRLSGSDGYLKAAEYMADQFEGLNLKPMGDDDYFQNFNLEYNEILAPCELKLIINEKEIKNFELGDDFVCRGFTGSGNFTAPVVFAGYGHSMPDIGYDDYSGIDVKNKIVMCFKYSPAWEINNKSWRDGNPREKSRIAYEHGALGILFVSFPNDAKPQKPIGSVISGNGEQIETFPQLHIDLSVAADFFQGSGYTLKDLQTRIDSTKQPFSISLKSSAYLNINAKYTKEQPAMNIIGMIEGSDPVLTNQYVVIGAHLDHVGSQAGKIYFPGANDNASGSAAVLEIAEAFVENQIIPKRSVLFVLFAAEENGLNGSKYFTANSPVPLDSITAMLNFDCIGIGDSIQIGSGKSSPKLWSIARKSDKELFNMMVERTWAGGGADATPFHEKEIPTLYFVTTNGYTHLHDMGDKPETLNPDLFEKIVKLGFVTALEAADNNYIREKLSE